MSANKGFTLVEVMITLGIVAGMGVAVSAILGFLAGQTSGSVYEQKVAKFKQTITKLEYRAIASLKSERFDPDSTFNQNGSPLPATMFDSALQQKYTWCFLGESFLKEKETDSIRYQKVVNALEAQSLAESIPSCPSATSSSGGHGVTATLDSHTIEFFKLSGDGDITKTRIYLLTSRCVARDADTFKYLGDGISTINPATPGVSALYVTHLLRRRPFYNTLASGATQRNSEIRCCEVSNPHCTDGSLNNWVVRTYGIQLDTENGKPLGIVEYPFLGELDPVIGHGFFLTMDSTKRTYTLNSINLVNRCWVKGLQKCVNLTQEPSKAVESYNRMPAVEIKAGVLQDPLSKGSVIQIGVK